MLLLYFLFWSAVAANNEQLYREMGDEIVLTPDSVVNPITSIEWKHGPDLAIDWYGGEPTAYRHFKDRGSLNTLTGDLTIRGLTADDSGIYTVEINNKVTSKTELLVISPVPKPTLSVSCDPEMTYCVLTCNGDTTGAEPVTYRWTSSDTWPSTKEHNITVENGELLFSCALENPVSSSSSEIVFNPFIENEPLYGKMDNQTVLTADSEDSVITSIVWKRGPDAAMVWYGDEIFSYQQFKDRGSLDTSTGDLTITGLTLDDSGNYTVEINNKVTSKTELLVISPVPKPSVSTWCPMAYCVLTCNGDTTDAEPVTYWWTSGDITWSSTKEHKITMVEKELWLSWFSCTFENPLGSNSSEKVFNPFIRNQLIAIPILLLVVCIIIITFKRKDIIDFSREWIKRALKWTFVYILICILVVFNIILMLDSNYDFSKELLTMMIILMTVFGVILVVFIVFFIYVVVKDKGWDADNVMFFIIAMAAPFLNMFNDMIDLIYKGSRGDLTTMIIVTAVVGVILLGSIIAFFIYTLRKGFSDDLTGMLFFMLFCLPAVFNIIINLIFESRKEYLTWMFYLSVVFGVIVVGCIISIIYLAVKGRTDDLILVPFFIAFFISTVFNIINLIYRAVQGNQTWMYIVIAIFVVILVGCIIGIIYLAVKDRIDTLFWGLFFIVVCLPGVFNIIINLVFKGKQADLTWMFNFLPLFILVGFIIIIIYFIYKGIMYFRGERRKRAAESARQGEAVEEAVPMQEK